MTRKLFVADLQRVIANCREYNPPDSEYCRCASALEKFFYFKLKEGGAHRQVVPSRGGTAASASALSPRKTLVPRPLQPETLQPLIP